MKSKIAVNLMTLRQKNGFSLEYIAEKIGISRQAVSKWEMGLSIPDLPNCQKLSELYRVTIDDLVNYQQAENEFGLPEVGKYIFGVVHLSEKGQIVIPKKAREVFNLKSGDALLILGDTTTPGRTGIAITKIESITVDGIINKIPKNGDEND